MNLHEKHVLFLPLYAALAVGLLAAAVAWGGGGESMVGAAADSDNARAIAARALRRDTREPAVVTSKAKDH
jgi:hypothetical protein